MTDLEREERSSLPARFRPARAAATIYDIAELAGVNASTVSRALSRPGRVSAQMEKRIQDAAKTLNYRVNPMARALPTGHTRTLGLIVADFTNPMNFEVVRGAERAASQRGYTLIISESQESGEREAETAQRIAPSVDGLILITTRLKDEQIGRLAALKPLVVINRRVKGVDAIVPDLAAGIGQTLAYLADVGHRSLAYLSGPDNSWMSRARWEALFAKALELGMTIVEIGSGVPTFTGGRDAMALVMASGVTAVVAYNDLMAIGLMRALQQQGSRVPGRLSVVGFDDIFGSDFTSPPLTTIRTPLDPMGELAVHQALDLIGDPSGFSATEEPWQLATELIIRGSTGPPTSVG